MKAKLLITFSLAAILLAAGCNQGNASKGADVEIFYLPHPPAQAVVKEIDKVLAGQKNITVKKISFLDENSADLVKKYNLQDHMPVAIIIKGKNTFTINAKQVTFRNFPKSNSFIPSGLGGNWDYSDLRKVLKQEF
jgi:ABC-type glycerol-3-phosphate transport system substrate-binding protein